MADVRSSVGLWPSNSRPISRTNTVMSMAPVPAADSSSSVLSRSMSVAHTKRPSQQSHNRNRSRSVSSNASHNPNNWARARTPHARPAQGYVGSGDSSWPDQQQWMRSENAIVANDVDWGRPPPVMSRTRAASVKVGGGKRHATLARSKSGTSLPLRSRPSGVSISASRQTQLTKSATLRERDYAEPLSESVTRSRTRNMMYDSMYDPVEPDLPPDVAADDDFVYDGVVSYGSQSESRLNQDNSFYSEPHSHRKTAMLSDSSISQNTERSAVRMGRMADQSQVRFDRSHSLKHRPKLKTSSTSLNRHQSMSTAKVTPKSQHAMNGISGLQVANVDLGGGIPDQYAVGHVFPDGNFDEENSFAPRMKRREATNSAYDCIYNLKPEQVYPGQGLQSTSKRKTDGGVSAETSLPLFADLHKQLSQILTCTEDNDHWECSNANTRRPRLDGSSSQQSNYDIVYDGMLAVDRPPLRQQSTYDVVDDGTLSVDQPPPPPCTPPALLDPANALHELAPSHASNMSPTILGGPSRQLSPANGPRRERRRSEVEDGMTELAPSWSTPVHELNLSSQ